jgi:glycosyltransferase involved in cell wall biosynthesis
MKILHIIPSISKKRGGPSTAIMSMVKALREEGVDAAILTTEDNKTYREEHMTLGRWFWLNDIPILMFPILNSESQILNEYLISPQLSWWLLQNIDKFDAIHVHSIFSYSSTTSMLIARLKRIPYMVRTIGQLNKWSLTQSRLKKMLMLLLIEKSNLLKSFAIHVTSRTEMEDLKLVCNHENILCLELGVTVAKIRSPLNHLKYQKIRFVFLSRIHPKKQLDKLLEAFSILYNTYNKTSWHLFIAGDGDCEYICSLKKLADEYGINDFIQWMGHLDEGEKVSLLRTCDWFVLPSISENFGLSVVEALANGLPVIISPEVGISDIIVENKVGLVTSASFTLVEALGISLQGAPMEMREAALKLVQERFSWEQIAKKLILFYTNQISTRKS